MAKDVVTALQWYRKAAEQDLADAQLSLGFHYATGTGVKTNEVEAVKWFRKAAYQNDPDAQGNLSTCYTFGLGVAKDFVQAYKWAWLAAEQGDQESKERVSKLVSLMTPGQIQEAQKFADQFRSVQRPSAK